MTIWLAHPRSVQPLTPTVPSLDAYREAVGELGRELMYATAAPGSPARQAYRAELVLERHLYRPELESLLRNTPGEMPGAVRRLLGEVRAYRPGPHNSAPSLAALIRSWLLTQIETVWWAGTRPYRTDADVRSSAELVDLDWLRRAGQLNFTYRLQATTLTSRALRVAERYARPGRAPRTAGLSIDRARPELVLLLNDVAADFSRYAPPGTPRLFVTSLARSVTHQRHLRALGYVAPLPSSHCVGYGADIEMDWFRRFDAYLVLRDLIIERQQAGQINVIDEDQAWHICLRPRHDPPRPSSTADAQPTGLSYSAVDTARREPPCRRQSLSLPRARQSAGRSRGR